MNRVSPREPETLDDLNFDAECNWLINQVMEPFKQSYQHLQIVCKQGYQYLETEWLGRKIQPLPTDPKVSAARIVSHLGLAFILLIPIINLIAFAILKALNITSFIFREGRTWGSLLGCDEEDPYLEAYYKQSMDGKALILEGFKLPEVPKASDEEYTRRKTLCINTIGRWEKEGTTNFACHDHIVQFDFEAILKQYDRSNSPEQLKTFYKFAETPEDDQENLNKIFALYNNRENSDEKVQYTIRMLSVIYGFLDAHKTSFKDPEQHKGLIRSIFFHIQNGHGNCINQVNSQIETAVLDMIRSASHKIHSSKETIEEYLCFQAAFEIYRYKIRLVKEIISLVCEKYDHQADLERALAHKIAKDLGLGIQSGSIVKFPEEALNKAANAFMIIYSQRFNSEKFLLDNLQSASKSLLKDLRNIILYWTSKNFGVEEDSEPDLKFVGAVSKDKPSGNGVLADLGADLKPEAVIFFLKEIGIFKALGGTQ